MTKKIIEIEDKNYLSEVISELPSHVLINKGITGCGGTTLELQCNRNSIIIVPTIALVKSKCAIKELHLFGVYGDINDQDILEYIESDLPYKKIMGTYDSLPKLMRVIPNYESYFLLIDEYHLFFNDYSFRNKAIQGVLQNFRLFDNWCFLTATPIKDEFILDELKDVDQITYKWKNEVKVHIDLLETYYVQRKLLVLIKECEDKNLHIFLNSLKTIKSVSKYIGNDYRVVCSEQHKQIKNYAEITSPVKKYNFYTSCAYEGSDIMDPNGLAIIVCDSNIATTMLDVSTKIRQICGRLRNSKYKDKVKIILDTHKHRYAGTNKDTFLKKVYITEQDAYSKLNLISKGTDREKIVELSYFTPEVYFPKYINQYNNKIFFDTNLKNIDLYNFELVSEIYSSSITVLTEYKNCQHYNVKYTPEIRATPPKSTPTWLVLTKVIYTYQELEEEFMQEFKDHGITWNSYTTIKKYFPSFTKKRLTIDGKKTLIYNFK